MRSKSCRQGFTLVEVLIAGALSVGLIGVLYQIFYATTQQSHKVSAKYQALRSALTASEILSRELDRLVTLPVAEDARGYPLPRYGDHVRPVRVAEDQRGVAFYVPGDATSGSDPTEISATPLTFDLVAGATGGVFAMRKSNAAGGATDEEAVEDGASRVYHGVRLRTLRFRLLSPGDAELALRSPDENFYLEAVIVGTDERGTEESPLSVLKALTFPSERRYDPARPALEYAPRGELEPPGMVINPTPEEAEAAQTLTELADQWADGTITNEELVERAREALDPLAGKTPTGALTSRQPTLPRLPPDTQVLTPQGSGTPVLGSPTGKGPVAVLPQTGPAQPSEGTYTFWGRARVFDSNGNEVWSDSFEESGNMANDGSEMDRIDSTFEQQRSALEQDMIRVRGQTEAAQSP